MNDQNNLSQEEALAAMKGQLGESSSDSTATNNPTVGVTAPISVAENAHPVTNQSVSLPPLDQQKVVKVFEDISNYMGDFFNSLKPVDAHFAQLADEEYAKARQIASKKNLTEQDFDDMMVNILSAITITGVGEMFKTIQTAQALNEVKKILREDAKDKLKSFKKTKKSISTIYEAANERFQEVSQNIDDPDDIYEKFCALRTTMYNDSLLDFLIATYEAANENKFQGKFNYPVLFFLNQSFLYNWILCIDEKTSSDEATLNTRRKYIKSFIEKIKRTITSNLTPTPEEIVFAKDPGLMAVAIHDYNPYETIGYTDDGNEVGVDSNSLHPDCADELLIFDDLYKVGDANSTQSDLANSLVQNKSLEEGVLHIRNLFSVSKDYQKRMLFININLILGGILGFVVSMAYGLKWYWSLGIGVVCCVLIAKFSPEKTITRKFMKKLNYVERAIKMTALNNGGYTEPINLQQIDVNNKSGCLLAVIGFLIGCLLGGPVGAIVGALIGFGVTKFLNSEEKPNNEYDYGSVSTGKAWKGYIVTAILAIGIILGIIRWIAPSSGLRSVFGSDKSSTEVIEAGYAENDESEIVIAGGAETPTSRQEETAKEAEKALYIIYCASEDETNSMAEYGEPIYSKHFKNKYKELGITGMESKRSAGSSGYTKAFDQLLNNVEKAESETDVPVIMDCDILFLSQETPSNFDLIINSIDITDENNVTIDALMKEYTDARWARKYVLKRENGVFKIDDIIDNGISTRKWLEEKIKQAYNFNGNEVTDNIGDRLKMSGKVGKFGVVFLLSISGDQVSGRYAYQSSLNKYGDKPENYLYLSGYLIDGNEMNLTSNQYNKDEIHEYINLKISGSSMSGTLRNANSGEVLPLELKIE